MSKNRFHILHALLWAAMMIVGSLLWPALGGEFVAWMLVAYILSENLLVYLIFGRDGEKPDC